MRAPIGAIALAFGLALVASPALAGDGWLTSYEEARTRARAEKKPILADFTGSDWCFWCKKLTKEVFSKAEFTAWAKDKVVLLELDYPAKKEQSAQLKAQNEALRKKYGIEGYPTVLFLDAEGEVLGKSGYLKGGPAEWTKSADAILAKAKAEAAAPKEPSAWSTDYEAALARAKKEGKLVLTDFTGSDWCHWCVRLKEEVFDTAEFKAWAKEKVVLLELDFPRKTPQAEALKARNRKLLEKYGVEGFPTILFLDGDGKEVGRSGYMRGGPAVWIPDAQKILDQEK